MIGRWTITADHVPQLGRYVAVVGPAFTGVPAQVMILDTTCGLMHEYSRDGNGEWAWREMPYVRTSDFLPEG